MKRRFSGILIVLWRIATVLLLCSLNSAAEAQEESIVRELYTFSTQVPWSTVRVRALVRLEEDVWSQDQINAEIESLLNLMPSVASDALKKLQINAISNSVAANHAGVRWLLYEETKVPYYYRLDLKDYKNVEPAANSELLNANIWDQSHINNYGRSEAHYKSATVALNREVILDNALKPNRWSQENLFVARYLEGDAAAALVLPLVAGIDAQERQRLTSKMRLEDSALFTGFRLNESELRNLLDGKAVNRSMTVNRGSDSNVWSIEMLTKGQQQGDVSWHWSVDRTLPYLVSKVILKSMAAEYSSERTGVTVLGFPSVWRVEKRDGTGKRTTKEIRILSATTNVDLSTVVVTSFPPGVQVWERFGTGSMRPVSGVTNEIIGLAPELSARRTRSAGRAKLIVVSVLFMTTIPFLWLVLRRFGRAPGTVQ